MIRCLVLGFIAGVLGVLVFHQGTAFLLHHLAPGVPELRFIFGQAPAPFRMAPVPPLGVPAVLSAAFWGGAWGVALALLLRSGRVPVLLLGFLFGAVVLTLVAFTLVAALKGLPPFAGGDRQIWWRAGLYNGAWGWGTALLLRAMPLAWR